MGTKTKKQSLKSGRPPTAQKTPTTLSSKTTQKTIVTYHNLQKALAKAQSLNDHTTISAIQTQLASLGGLKAYQAASILGQSSTRGGDSSAQLLKWLPYPTALPKLRMLEVGALSTQNECSKSGRFEPIVRIDLHSQEKGILQQDFMQRPLPTSDDEKFDVISLSLVLNFVPDAKGRGEMLRRTTEFLLQKQEDWCALLFLVLPAPCVANSRYFNDERLTLIMASLGYVMVQRKQTSKLVYYLWQLRDRPVPKREQKFGKLKVRDGAAMNNFHVVLEPEGSSN